VRDFWQFCKISRKSAGPLQAYRLTRRYVSALS
jgi:hypothetical protein